MLFSFVPNQKVWLLNLLRVYSSLLLCSFEPIRVCCFDFESDFCFALLLPFGFHIPAPRSWFNSIRIAYSRYSFGLFLTESFLRTLSLLAFFYNWFSLTGVIFAPVVANIFAVFSLSRRTGLVLPAVIGWFSFPILPLQVISFRNLSSRNAWFQFAFWFRNCFDPVVANIFAAVSCSEEPIQSGQTATGLKNFLALLCSWFLSVFLSFRTTLSYFLLCTKVALILLLPAFRSFFLSLKTCTAEVMPDKKRLPGF